MRTSETVPQSLRVGLVLGAGGEMGGVYIRSALAALEDATGWSASTAHTVVGTSAGALNGARLPDRPDRAACEATNALARLADGFSAPHRRPTDPLVRAGRRVGGHLVALLTPISTRAASYDVAPPPFHRRLEIVTVKRRRGSRIVHRLAEADDPASVLYASAAVPWGVRPVELSGRLHIDGAVWSPTNADLISPRDHDVLVVIAPMASRDGGTLLRRSHRAQLVGEVARWRRAGKPTLLILPDADDDTARRSPDQFAAAARRVIESAHRAVTP